MDTKNLEVKIDGLKASIDTLILIELCSHGITREEAREVFGTLNNNLFASVNKIINPKGKK